jgi:hypothetical protein
MAKAETPFQKSVWAAWDLLQGTENIRDTDSFEFQAGAAALSASVDALDSSDSDKADKIARSVASLEKHSRKWRVAYNLMLEGRSIDITRLVKDLGDSQKKVLTIKKGLQQISRMKMRDDSQDSIEREVRDALTTADALDDALQAAQEKGLVAAEGELGKKASSARVALSHMRRRPQKRPMPKSRHASTNTERDFYKASDGKWYVDNEDYDEDEDGEQIEGDTTSYGPFPSFEAADKYMSRNFANSGGYGEDDSGRQRPPRNPVSPRRRQW